MKNKNNKKASTKKQQPSTAMRNKSDTKLTVPNMPNYNNSNAKPNSKSTDGLGNSLFRGQKFIDFQEPFNESIKPIRNVSGGNRSNLNADNNIYVLSSGKRKESVELDDYATENINLQQVEIKENYEDELIFIHKSDYTYHVYSPKEGNKRNMENGNVENNEEVGVEKIGDNAENNFSYGSGNSEKKDNLIRNSKYFNNLNFPLQQKSQNPSPVKQKAQSFIGDDSHNYLRPISDAKKGKDNQINSEKKAPNNTNTDIPSSNEKNINVETNFFDDRNKGSQESVKSGANYNHTHSNTNNALFSTKANSNYLATMGYMNPNTLTNNNFASGLASNNDNYIGQAEIGPNNNVENLEFLNTLLRLKSGGKLDASLIAASTNNFNNNPPSNNIYNYMNRNDDDSKSYIKELLEMCSGSGERNIHEISNFEIKNLDNECFTGNSQSVTNSFILTNNNQCNSNRVQGNNYWNNLNNSANNVDASQLNNLEDQNFNLNNVLLNMQNINYNHPRSLKREELIEISNKRRNMIENSSANDAYLRRRHVEALTKIEKMRKEKEEKEKSENKFVPVINKKSKEIIAEKVGAGRINPKNSMGAERVSNNYKPNINHQYDKSSDRVLLYPEDNNQETNSEKKSLRINNDIINQIDNILYEEKQIEGYDAVNTKQSDKAKKKRNNSTGSIRYETSFAKEDQYIDNAVKIPCTGNNKEKGAINSKKGYGTINLEINNRIYMPNQGEKLKPTLETPNYKNYILTSNDMVNYGTKTNSNVVNNKEKAIDNFRNPPNIPIPNQNNYNSNNAGNNYETNKNFVFSYDSNNIKKELQENNRQEVASKPHTVINTDPAENNEEVDHVEINLFDGENSYINTQTSSKNNQNKILTNSNNHTATNLNRFQSVKESSNLENTKTSLIQLFPVNDKLDFQMECINTNQNTNPNNNQTSQNNINLVSMRSKDESNADYKMNYNTHLNSDFISVENSEINEYNSEINKKQNQSTNLGLYINNNTEEQNYNKGTPNNASNNLNLNLNTNRPSNLTHDNVSLNFSKFTNFVGMSEQYSKKVFNPKVLNNNYYNQILSKNQTQSTKNIHNNTNNITQNNDISNRNMINSYMSNEVLNKIPSYKTIDTNNPLLNFDSKSQFVNSVLSSGKEREQINFTGNNSHMINQSHFPITHRTASPIIEHTPVIAEINLSDDEFGGSEEVSQRKINNSNEVSKRDSTEYKKLNYFDREGDNLLESRNKMISRPKDKIFIEENNSEGDNDNQLGGEEDDKDKYNYPDIDDLIKPKHLHKVKFEKPKKNPFVMGKKKLSKSMGKIKLLEEKRSENNSRNESILAPTMGQVNLTIEEKHARNNSIMNINSSVVKESGLSTERPDRSKSGIKRSFIVAAKNTINTNAVSKPVKKDEKAKSNLKMANIKSPEVKKDINNKTNVNNKDTIKTPVKNKIPVTTKKSNEKSNKKNIKTQINIDNKKIMKSVEINNTKERKNIVPGESQYFVKSNSEEFVNEFQSQDMLQNDKEIISLNVDENLSESIVITDKKEIMTGANLSTIQKTPRHEKKEESVLSTPGKSKFNIITADENNSKMENEFEQSKMLHRESMNRSIPADIGSLLDKSEVNIENLIKSQTLNTNDYNKEETNTHLPPSKKISSTNSIPTKANINLFSDKDSSYLDHSAKKSKREESFICEVPEERTQINKSTEVPYAYKTKTRSTLNTNRPNYEYAKFSLDIVNTNPNSITNTLPNKTKNADSPLNIVNDYVSNSIKMHRVSQENCQKQINELLNKIKKSQEENEGIIKKDLKSFNINESNMSSYLKDPGMSSSFKYEYETDLENVDINMITSTFHRNKNYN